MKRIYLLVFYVLISCHFISACSEDDSPVINTSPTTPVIEEVPRSVWKFSSEPVISTRAGSWDSEIVSACEVVLFKDTLRMWYEGSPSIFDDPMHLGYAWSLDGVVWTRFDDPVFMANSGQWDYPHLAAPSVFVDGDTLRMWYGAGVYDELGMSIGYATSVDGVQWERHGKVISPLKDWNPGGVIPGPVLKEEGVYKMWLSGGHGHIGAPTEETFWTVGYATSTDGIQWDVSDTSVIYNGTSGAFDHNSVLAGTVINADTAYVMYYSGALRLNNISPVQIAMAFSSDGIEWTKYENNPIMERSSSSIAMYFPQVLDYKGEYRMWYAAWHPGPSIHTATATN